MNYFEIQTLVTGKVNEGLTDVELVKRVIEQEKKSVLEFSDVSFVEKAFADAVVTLWREECVDSMNRKVKAIKIDELVNLLTSMNNLSVENIPKFLQTKTYQIVKISKVEFDQKLLNNLFETLIEISNEALNKIKGSAQVELKFFETLMKVLKTSYEFNAVCNSLDLSLFVSGDLSMNQLVQRISRSLAIDDSLRNHANQLLATESFCLEDQIRTAVGEYIEPLEITHLHDGKSILRVLKKNLRFKDIKSYMKSKYDELQIVASTFFIDDDLPEIFRGKNVCVLANTIYVKSPVLWDVSGIHEVKQFSENAGTDSNGKGINGKKGDAGESGGNVAISAHKIKNPENLKIISNGGNASDGQDGGNGVDGKNGKNVERSDFSIDGFEVGVKFNWLERKELLSLNKTCTENEITKIFYHHWYFYMGSSCLMICKGSKGQAGTSGGAPGAGAQGGFAGDVMIETRDDSKNDVAKIVNKGKDGKMGTPGFNGRYGIDGRDGVFYDQSVWSIGEYKGLENGEYYKYEVKNGQGVGRYIWDGNRDVHAAYVRSIKQSRSEQKRFDDYEKNNYQLMTKAAQKSPIFLNKIKNENSAYLNEDASEALSIIAQVESLSASQYKRFDEKSKVRTLFQRKHEPLDVDEVQNCREEGKTTKMELSEVLRELETGKSVRNMQKALRNCELSMNDYEKCLRVFSDRKSLSVDILLEIAEFYMKKREINCDMKSKFLKFHEGKQKKIEIYSVFLVKELERDQELKKLFYQSLTEFEEKLAVSKENLLKSVYSKFKAAMAEKFNFKETLNDVEFKEKLQNYLDHDCSFFVQDLCSENLSKASLKKLIQEKIFFSALEELKTNVDMNSGIKVVNIEKLQPIELVPFLVKAKNFNFNIKTVGNFYSFESYFRDDNKIRRKTVRDFFEDLLATESNFKSDIFESAAVSFMKEYKKSFFLPQKFKVFIEELSEIDEKFLFLESDEVQAEQLKEITENFELTVKKIAKRRVWKRFYECDEIKEAFLNFLEEDEVQTATYRRLLSHIFNVNIRVYCHDIEDNLTLKEAHQVSKNVETVHILLTNNTFIKLDIDINRFNIETTRNQISAQCKDWLRDTCDEKFTIPLTENSIKIEFLKFFKAESEEIENLKLKIDSLLSVNSGKILLDALITKLHNDGFHLTFSQFSTVFSNVINYVSENSQLVSLFTLLFLSKKQIDWLFEIVFMRLEDFSKNFNKNTKQKWLEIFQQVKFPEIFVTFMEKFEELKNDKIQEDDLEEILSSLLVFTPKNHKKLTESPLKSWKNVLVSEHWHSKLEEVKQNEKLRELTQQKLVLLSMNLESLYGKEKVEAIFRMLIRRGNETTNIDLLPMFKGFYNGKYQMNSKTFELLSKLKVDQWIITLEKLQKFQGSQRDVKEICRLVNEDDETSSGVKENLGLIEKTIAEMFELKCPQQGKKFIDFSLSEVENWALTAKNSGKDVSEMMAVIYRAFELKHKNKIKLRYVQIVSVLSLFFNSKGILVQVATGEGKTFIGLGFSLLKFFQGEKVDIVTSSSVLAERDATDDFHIAVSSVFGVSIDHNCHDSPELRQIAYSQDIVYGTLTNYQRDHLLTEFYGYNLLSSQRFENVLIDEVDSLLLDKGNNILYLSKDLPDIDELESIFVFLWKIVNTPCENLDEMAHLLKTENVRKSFLDEAFGLLSLEIIKEMSCEEEETEKAFNELLKLGFVNEEGVMNMKQYKENKLSESISESLKNKIKFKFHRNAQRQKIVKIPMCLEKFVFLHLNKWIESAVKALFMENGREYIVDRDRTGTSMDKNPNIVILDLDTGTDQASSQWDEGLHQFLQLKHECALSLLSLKSVFISNVTFFKLFKKTYGMTGTLGSLPERQSLQKMHEIDFVNIPTFVPKQYRNYDEIVKETEEEYIQAICNEILDILTQDRSTLIICQTIQDIKQLQAGIMSELKLTIGENLHIFERDYQKIEIENLKKGNVIIATNLAGRGTDIKLHDDLKNCGGLHVILTFLPTNIRLENQAFGRAARAGNKGSGRMIIHDNSNLSITDLKISRNEKEVERINEISDYYENFIKIEEGLYKKFRSFYKETIEEQEELNSFSIQNLALQAFFVNSSEEAKSLILEKWHESSKTELNIKMDNLLVEWAFWLDENATLVEESKVSEAKKNQIFNSFDSKFKNLDTTPLQPSTRIKLMKVYVDDNKMDKAIQVLNSNEFSDLFTLDYYSTMLKLKQNQANTGNAKRNLESCEIDSLKKLLIRLDERIKDREVRKMLVASTAQKHRKNLIEIEGFKKQQDKFNSMDHIIADSINKFLGVSVNENSFVGSCNVSSIVSEEIYKKLKSEKMLSQMKLSTGFAKKRGKIVAREFFLDEENFLEFLMSYEDANLQDFCSEVKRKFKFPDLEDFWKILVKNEVIQDEQKLFVLDKSLLESFDPSALEKFDELTKTNKIKIQEAKSEKNEIFMFSLADMDDQKALLTPEDAKQALPRVFDFCQAKKIIFPNKKASLNMEKLENLMKDFKFDLFDKIKVDDFKKIQIDPKTAQEILDSLVTQEFLEKNKNSYNLQCFYTDLYYMDLKQNSVYLQAVFELLKNCFSYRIALQKLLYDLKNGNENITISLELNKHYGLVSALRLNQIIDPEKMKSHKVAEVKSSFKQILSNCELHELFKSTFPKQSGREIIISHLKNLGIFRAPKLKERLIPVLPSFFNETFVGWIADGVETTVNAVNTAIDVTNESLKKVHDILDEKFPLKTDHDDIIKLLKKHKEFSVDPIATTRKLLNGITELTADQWVIELDVNKNLNISHQSTIKLVLKNARIIFDKRDNIETVLKNSVCLLQREDIERAEIFFHPLKNLDCNLESTAEFAVYELKQLDAVFDVQEEKYSWVYWVRFSTVVIIGMVQIAVGALMTYLSAGILTKIGQSFISEGISDLIFTFNTLRTGHFKWSDYGNHKLISIIQSVCVFGATQLLSRVKCLRWLFKAEKGQEFGEKIAGKGAFEKMSGWKMLRQGGKISTETGKQMAELTGKKVASSVVKAGSMAIVSYGVEKWTENGLNDWIMSLSQKISPNVGNKFDNHELQKTIEEMVNALGPEKAYQAIIECAQKAVSDREATQNLITKFTSQIQNTIQTTNKTMSFIGMISLFDKIVAFGFIYTYAGSVYDKFNQNMLNSLKLITKNPQSSHDSAEIKQKTREFMTKKIDDNVAQIVRTDIVGSLLKLGANQALQYAGTFIKNEATKLINSYNEENNLAKVKEVKGKINELNKNSNLSENEKSFKQKVYHQKLLKISANTKCPKVFAEVLKTDVPMTKVGVDATISAMKQMNLDLYLVITHDGIIHEFGDKNGKRVDLNITDGHMENSKNNDFGNNCFYNALVDKVPEIGNITAEQFRTRVADAVINDPAVCQQVRGGYNRFYTNIGFSCGNKKALKRGGENLITDSGSKIPRGGQWGIRNDDEYKHHMRNPLNADVRTPDQKDINAFKNLEDFQEINDKRAEAIKKAIDIIEKNTGFKIDLNNPDMFDVTHYSEVKMVVDGYIQFFYIPVEIKVKEKYLVDHNNKMKSNTKSSGKNKENYAEIKNIDMNIDDMTHQLGNDGPQVSHVGIEIKRQGEKSQLGHVLFGDLHDSKIYKDPNSKTDLKFTNPSRNKNSEFGNRSCVKYLEEITFSPRIWIDQKIQMPLMSSTNESLITKNCAETAETKRLMDSYILRTNNH